jgi:hypothetical protein
VLALTPLQSHLPKTVIFIPSALAAALADRYAIDPELGRRFFFTLGSHESDVWVAALDQR